ncbi:MAG: hypothetical protein PHU25_18710 [Deltaproteobacteria bacterium]|nr:hypothetical protein [Deltaproteobacteria bacterium]
MLRQSGGQLETTRTASAHGVSRATVESHLQALEITHALRLVRPFHGVGQAEIVRQPKAYAFDTGFVVAPIGAPAYVKRFKDLEVTVCDLDAL